MTVVFLTSASGSPWSRPTDWSDAGHTVNLVGCGGRGGAGSTGTSHRSGTGGGGGAHGLLTPTSGLLASTTPFLVSSNSVITGGVADSTTWEGTDPAVNCYRANSGEVGKAGGVDTTGGAAGAVTVKIGTPSPVTYTISQNNTGGTGGITASVAGSGSGGGGPGGPSGIGAAGGPCVTAARGGGGGGGANNGSVGGGTSASSTGANGGNGPGGTGGGTGSGSGIGGAGTTNTGGGGGGGFFAAAQTNCTGGAGGDDDIWTQTSDSATDGPGGGGGGGGGCSQNTGGHTSSGGAGARYGAGGGGAGGTRSSTSTRVGGTGASGLIVITYTAVNPPMPADANAFSLTGVAVTTSTKTPAAAASNTLTGQAVLFSNTTPAAAASFALSGQAVDLERHEAAGAASFALTGQDITPRIATLMSAEAGSFALTGQSTLSTTTTPAAVNAFALSGQQVSLRASLPATASSFVLSGQTTAQTIRSPAAANAFTLAGQPVLHIISVLAEGVNVVTDDFNRVDGGLGANWTTVPGFTAPAIQSNEVKVSSSTSFAYWNANEFPPDQFVECTVANLGVSTNIHATLRHQVGNRDSFYAATLTTSFFIIRKYTAGASSTLVFGSPPFTTGDILRFEVTGSTLDLKQNGVSVLSTSDSSYSDGSPGLGIVASSARLDDWSAGPITDSVLTLTLNGRNISTTLQTLAEAGSLTLTGQSVTTLTRMAAVTGAFTFTGQDITLVAGASMAAAAGSFAFTGQTVTYRIVSATAAGSFTLAGQDATFHTIVSVPAAAASFALTGQNVTSTVRSPATAASFTLAGQSTAYRANSISAAAAFSLTGQSVDTAVRSSVAATSFALTGQDVSFHSVVSIPAAAGAFVLTGQAITTTQRLVFGAGSFTFTGQTVTFPASNSVIPEDGSFVFTGQAAVLSAHLAVTLGSFTVAGQDVAFRTIASSSVEAGAFALTGQAVAARSTLTAGLGSFALTGQDVTFPTEASVIAEAAAFVLTGQDVTFPSEGLSVVAEAAAFALTGQATAHSVHLAVAPASFAVTGQDVGLQVSFIAAEAGSFALTGQNIIPYLAGAATDDFDRAGPDLGENWTAFDANVLEIASFLAVPSVSDVHCAHYWNADGFRDDQFAQCTISEIEPNSVIGLLLRVQIEEPAYTYYAAYYGSDGLVTIFKWVNGEAFLVVDVGITPTSGDIFRFEIIETTLIAKVNGVVVAAYVDDSLAGGVGPFTSGPAGLSIFVSGGPVSANDWLAGPIAAEDIFVPVDPVFFELSVQDVFFRTIIPVVKGSFVLTGQTVNLGSTGADLRRRVVIRGRREEISIEAISGRREQPSMSGNRSPAIT